MVLAGEMAGGIQVRLDFLFLLYQDKRKIKKHFFTEKILIVLFLFCFSPEFRFARRGRQKRNKKGAPLIDDSPIKG